MFAVPCRIDRRRSKSCLESHQRTVKRLFLWVMFMDVRRLVFGVGINDADYAVMSKAGRAIIWRCPFYQAWYNMLQRCHSEKRHLRNPTYSGCTTSPEWLRFSNFRKWMHSQGWQGNHLDKDLLYPGNKHYSALTCVFISPQLNKFLCDSAAIRGDWPIGVCWAKREEKFLSRCCDPFDGGKHKFLGYFDCPKLAHHAWRIAKHGHALTYANMQTDPRIAEALRTRYLVNKEFTDAAS